MSSVYRFISEEEMKNLLKGEPITSPTYGYVHTLNEKIQSKIIKDVPSYVQLSKSEKIEFVKTDSIFTHVSEAMGYMVGTISEDYLIEIEPTEIVGEGVGTYAVDDYSDIAFIEIFLNSYSIDNVKSVSTGDFWMMSGIKTLSIKDFLKSVSD